MGLLKWLFRALFGGGVEGREAGTEREIEAEKAITQEAEAEKGIEAQERKCMERIIKILNKNFPEKYYASGKDKEGRKTSIELGGYYNATALRGVIVKNLAQALSQNISLKEEEILLNNTRTAWTGLREWLIGLKDVKEVPKQNTVILAKEAEELFNQLGVYVKFEEQITEEKMKRMKEQYELASKERG